MDEKLALQAFKCSDLNLQCSGVTQDCSLIFCTFNFKHILSFSFMIFLYEIRFVQEMFKIPKVESQL